MNKKALILGGNRFFGKKLAKLLINKKYKVTLLNRGNSEDELGDKVSRIICDRTDFAKLSSLMKEKKWDFVFDQICYDYKTAKQSCEVFDGKVKNYIFTSTQSVYEQKANLSESDFKPESYEMKSEVKTTENYGEAKKQAEYAFHKFANFPVISARFPIVIGEDDYTTRFSFHVNNILHGTPIYFPNLEACISFISSDEAAKSLLHLAKSNFKGSINVSSPKAIKLSDFVELIETQVGKKLVKASQPTKDNHSPFGITKDWYASCDLLKENGLKLTEIKDWLPEKVNLVLKQ